MLAWAPVELASRHMHMVLHPAFEQQAQAPTPSFMTMAKHLPQL
jgi:hypothetical protein